MWKKLHQRRSVVLSPSSIDIDNDDESCVGSDPLGDKMAVVMPFDLEHIAETRTLTLQRAGTPRPLSPQPSGEFRSNGAAVKQKRRRSLLANLLPRRVGSPSIQDFITRESSSSPSPPTSPPPGTTPKFVSPSVQPSTAATQSRGESRPFTPTLDSSRSQATHSRATSVSQDTAFSLTAGSSAHESVPRYPNSSSSKTVPASNSLPPRLPVTPTPSTIGIPPRPPRKSLLRRPSTAPSTPSASSPFSIFSSSNAAVTGDSVLLAMEKPSKGLESGSGLMKTRHDIIGSHQFHVPDETEQNRESVASDLTVRATVLPSDSVLSSTHTTHSPRSNTTKDLLRPNTSPSPSVGHNLARSLSQPNPRRKFSHLEQKLDPESPPLTPFGLKVTAAVLSLNPSLPDPSPNSFNRINVPRSVTLPNTPPPAAIDNFTSVGLERKSIPNEWLRSAKDKSTSMESIRRHEEDAISTHVPRLSRSQSRDGVPLVSTSTIPTSTSNVAIRKSATTCTGLVSTSASSSEARSTYKPTLKRSNTVDMHGNLHQGNGIGSSSSHSSDPRQIAFERRERARNVWRARKMARLFGSEPPAELLQSMSIANSQSMPDMLNTRRMSYFGSVLDGDDDDDVLSVRLPEPDFGPSLENGSIVKDAEKEREKEEGNQSPISTSSPPESSGLPTPESSLDLGHGSGAGSPIHLRFGINENPTSRPSDNILDEEEEEEESILRADFRLRRMRARRLERFFGVPVPKFQEQLPSAVSPKPADYTVEISSVIAPTPVPRPMKRQSKSSIALSTSSGQHSRSDSMTELIQRDHSRPFSDSRRPPHHIQPIQTHLLQHTQNSHSISTSTPSARSASSPISHSHSFSHVDIGVERGKRWPPLTAMVRDVDRDRVKPHIVRVDENNAEQMREVMVRLRKLR